MNDDTANPENATTQIQPTRREPPAPANTQNQDELPWWQTIYHRPPGPFHNTPQYRAQASVRPLASPRRPVVPPQARPEPPEAPRPLSANAHRAAMPPIRPADQTHASSTTRPKPQSQSQSQQRRKLIGIGAGVLAVEAVALVIGVSILGAAKTTELDVNQAEQGVVQILTDAVSGYGVTNISDVRCNNGVNPPVKKDSTFKCEATVDGRQRQVTVVFVDDNGTYEVGSPTG